MPKIVAPANKEVMSWARKIMGYEHGDVAHKLHIKADQIELWEKGQANPTLRQLEMLADLYQQPLVTFFQKVLPDEPYWPTDYRTFRDGEQRPFSPVTKLAIREAEWRQSVADELRRELDIKFRLSLETLSVRGDPENAAASVRQKIGPDISVQAGWARQPDQLFKNWRRILEDTGILVFKLNFPIEDARGFSLRDSVSPVITVSSKDYLCASIFTLFHELAHLLYNESGACNDIEYYNESRSDKERIEIRCNHFAGAFLVPKNGLLSNNIVVTNKGTSWDDAQLSDLAKYFGVSREVVLRRLLILNRTSNDFYRTWRARQKEYWKDRELPKKGFPVLRGYARKRIGQQGEAYVRTVLDAYANKLINLSETSEYLNVKINHIRDIEAVLAEGGD
jgi:Zn-dependent peptidase ImmA (M78 family)/DNA-binding XRE family transcriptional regulator